MLGRLASAGCFAITLTALGQLVALAARLLRPPPDLSAAAAAAAAMTPPPAAFPEAAKAAPVREHAQADLVGVVLDCVHQVLAAVLPTAERKGLARAPRCVATWTSSHRFLIRWDAMPP